jgi:hypothetical protein
VAAACNPSTYGNVSSSTPETDLNAMHLEAIKALSRKFLVGQYYVKEYRLLLVM